MRHRVRSGTGASTRRSNRARATATPTSRTFALTGLVQPMRIALIQVMQETCSFNPTPTTLDDFASFGILEGSEMLTRSDSVGPIGGYVEGLAQSGVAVETVPIVRGTAQSGGRLTSEAFDFFDAKVRDGLLEAGAARRHRHAPPRRGVRRRPRRRRGRPARLRPSSRRTVTAGRRDARPPRQRDRGDDRNADIVMGFRTQPHDQFETARDLTRARRAARSPARSLRRSHGASCA